MVGVDEADGLARTCAVAVLKPGRIANEEELRSFVKDALAPYKCPKCITFATELPKTATGKLKRYVLRDQLRGNT